MSNNGTNQCHVPPDRRGMQYLFSDSLAKMQNLNVIMKHQTENGQNVKVKARLRSWSGLDRCERAEGTQPDTRKQCLIQNWILVPCKGLKQGGKTRWGLGGGKKSTGAPWWCSG